MKNTIKVLDTADGRQIARCFRVFSILRPHLDEPEFIRRVRAQAEEGYRVAYIESADEIVAAAGYCVARFLAWAKVLYLDDLITHPEKSHISDRC
jgi:hypothetical protein